jgi:hypothetical protein
MVNAQMKEKLIDVDQELVVVQQENAVVNMVGVELLKNIVVLLMVVKMIMVVAVINVR